MRFVIPVFAAATLTACIPTFEGDHFTANPPAVQPFEEIATSFTHVWEEPSHPFTGAAVIDVDGDGSLEVFVGGGRGQNDRLLKFQDNALENVIESTNLSDATVATYGSASSDLDGDGDVDLAVVRDNGLSLYINEGGSFTKQSVPLNLAKDAVPVSVTIADIEGDGDADIYVSVFVAFPAFQSATFNDPSHAKPNIMLRNNGDLTFTDVTEASGTAGTQNTFMAVFADLDNDRDQDLILSQNTAQVEILENMGDGTFRDRGVDTGYGFWMGLGVTDIDGDGDLDFFASNVGTSIPNFLTTGDILDTQRHNTEWGLFRNDGNFKFTDVTDEYRLGDYGFAWGAQFADLNLDGKEDILVAQNYIKWPLHKLRPLPGKALLRLDAPEGPAFYQVPGLGLDNAKFAQSPLIADMNGDGRPDVLWLNMDGPFRAFINQSSGNHLTVRLPDDVTYHGATVTATLGDGSTIIRRVVASTGLMTDPTPDVHMGLGNTGSVRSVTVETLKGETTTIHNPAVNQVIDIVKP